MSGKQLTDRQLTIDEFNLLQTITADNKMDCWFFLIHNPETDEDVVYDLENDNKEMSLKEAIGTIAEGYLTEDYAALSKEDKETWDNLLNRFNIKY